MTLQLGLKAIILPINATMSVIVAKIATKIVSVSQKTTYLIPLFMSSSMSNSFQSKYFTKYGATQVFTFVAPVINCSCESLLAALLCDCQRIGSIHFARYQGP